VKKGFGLLEVMISAVVLGFLLVGLNLLQKGNREAVIRIRTRDAAQIIAQNFMDSLSRLGIESIKTGGPATVDKEWEGNGGKIIDKRTYTITWDVENINSIESSDYARYSGVDTLNVSAKRVNLTVRWPFKNNNLEIKEERIIK